MSDSEVEISRLDPISLAKISGAVYGLMAIIFSLLYVPFILLGMVSSMGSSSIGAGSVLGGAFAGLFIAAFAIVFYAVIGAIFGAIGGFVYNFVASKIGGIEVEYRQLE
jgi:hypothetical protein